MTWFNITKKDIDLPDEEIIVMWVKTPMGFKMPINKFGKVPPSIAEQALREKEELEHKLQYLTDKLRLGVVYGHDKELHDEKEE